MNERALSWERSTAVDVTPTSARWHTLARPGPRSRRQRSCPPRSRDSAPPCEAHAETAAKTLVAAARLRYPGGGPVAVSTYRTHASVAATVLAGLATLLTSPSSAEASWRTACGVAYQRADLTWSRAYDQECTFFFGQELSAATGRYDFMPMDVYVAFWWGDGQASIVHASTLIALDWDYDFRFSHADAQQTFQVLGAFEGDQRERGRVRRWRISVRRDLLGQWSTF